MARSSRCPGCSTSWRRRIDGSRDAPAIAELVSDDLGRPLNADQVRYLITAKLLPLGILATNGAPRTLPRANPLLALRARGTLLPERAANAVGMFFRPLFRWPVIVAVLVSVAAMDYWVFAVHGLTAGAQQVLRDPVDVVVVFALSVVSGLFHECGHAAGCRYGGARSGRIGVGIYLVWPSFFTNVTDSYRLSRGGRLRTDLGGLYFDLIFILALAGLYVATSSEILLLVIAITHLEMLEQLLPFVRFDGYFILSDLIGVPDLFARVVPILKSAAVQGSQGPAHRRNAAERPDDSDRLGAMRHPAACVHPRVHAVAPPRDGPRTVAFLEPAGAPHGDGGRWPPVRGSQRRFHQHTFGGPAGRRVGLHRCRACAQGRDAGPALVRRIPAQAPSGLRRRSGLADLARTVLDRRTASSVAGEAGFPAPLACEHARAGA